MSRVTMTWWSTPVGHERVVDEVGCAVCCGERHGDDEVRGGEAEQNEDEEFAGPCRE